MIILYECEGCRKEVKKHFSKRRDIKDTIECEECGGESIRQLSAPTSKSTQVLDNGFQAKKVEIVSEVVEKERQRIVNGEKE